MCRKWQLFGLILTALGAGMFLAGILDAPLFRIILGIVSVTTGILLLKKV